MTIGLVAPVITFGASLVKSEIGIPKGYASNGIFRNEISNLSTMLSGLRTRYFEFTRLWTIIAGIWATAAAQHGKRDAAGSDDLIAEPADIELIPPRERHAIEVLEKAGLQ
jgi:hypothetical protein